MAGASIDRGIKAVTGKQKRYSVFSLAKNASSYHQNWQQAWRHAEPKPRRELRDLLDGRAVVTREERVEVLLDEEAGGRQHTDTTVRQLGLAPAHHLLLGLALEEVGRVEVASGRDVAGET